MKQKNSNLRIAKPEGAVKGSAALAAWQKEQLEKYRERGKELKKGKDTKYFVRANRTYFLNDCKNLTGPEVLAKIVIDLHMNQWTGEAIVGLKTLLPLCHLSMASLKRAVASLKKKRVFKIVRTKGNVNHYVDVELQKKINLC